MLGKLVVKYVPTHTKGTLKKKKKKKKKKKQKKKKETDLPKYAYVMFFLCFCFFVFFLIFFIKAYVVGTHLNCIDKLMQFRLVPTTYAFIKK